MRHHQQDTGMQERLASSRDDDICRAVLDGPTCNSQRVEAANCVVNRRLAIALNTIAQRYLAHVRYLQPCYRRKSAHKAWSAHMQCLDLLQHILYPAHRIGYYRAHSVWILFCQFHLRVLQSFLDGSKDEVGHAVRSLCQLAVDKVLDYKVAGFTGYRDRQTSRGETLHSLDTGNPLPRSMPEGLFPRPVGSHYTQPCNDDPALFFKRHVYQSSPVVLE